jgi:class 3 adenylate cyclase
VHGLRCEIREGARFCDSCGAPQAAPIDTQEQRKTVTVVFCDVTGSTASGERLDAESFRRVMARYFDEARRVIERHGGTVEKFIGDAVMAVFGVPVVHEDDAVRAVRAADELRRAIGLLNDELAHDYDTTLELRIGVNTGEVVTGTEERLATGDAVNVAARLQQAAAPGEILLGPETRALARDAVTVEELAAAVAMHAGRFDEARTHARRARTVAAERGMDLHDQSSGMVLGQIELMAGDAEAAERVLRESCDRLAELGETGYRSTVAGFLAEALYELGRDDEAQEILDLVAQIAQSDDVEPQLRLRTVGARLLARRGDHEAAVRLARQGIELASTTDYLDLNAQAHLALAEVLRASGSPGETDALRAALDFYERKESVPMIDFTRTLLTAAAAASP